VEVNGDATRTVSIMRAKDGLVGMKFARQFGVETGPFGVTRIDPGSAAELSGVVRVGDFICAVKGRDVCALTSESVAGLCLGAPSTPLILTLWFSKSTRLAARLSMQGMYGLKVRWGTKPTGNQRYTVRTELFQRCHIITHTCRNHGDRDAVQARIHV